MKTGRHIVFPRNTPLCNLYHSMLDMSGVKVDRFGDSSGKLRVEMGMFARGPGVMFYDTQGKRRVELGMMFSKIGETLSQRVLNLILKMIMAMLMLKRL